MSFQDSPVDYAIFVFEWGVFGFAKVICQSCGSDADLLL